MNKYEKLGLKYRKLDMNASEILVFSHWSFSTLSGMSDGPSQLEYIKLISYRNDKGNISEFSRTQSRRVVRSAHCPETFIMAVACNAAIVIQHEIVKILKNKLRN